MGSTREKAYESNAMSARVAMMMLKGVLASIPTMFGKLVWISSFRVVGPATYHCPHLEEIVSTATARTVLRDLHERLFSSWIALTLQEQSRELTAYIHGLRFSADPRQTLPQTAKNLIPPSAKHSQRYLFETNIAVVFARAAIRD